MITAYLLIIISGNLPQVPMHVPYPYRSERECNEAFKQMRSGSYIMHGCLPVKIPYSEQFYRNMDSHVPQSLKE